MYDIRKISKDVLYIGCSDRRLALFESAYPIPNGVSYNSYLILDEKTVLMDTVDKSCSGQFFQNLEAALDGRNLDYLFVHHMEPDHCALLEDVISVYPEVKIVTTAKSVALIKQFFDFDIDSKVMIVKEGDTLNTGKHEFIFTTAPMVHWPEVFIRRMHSVLLAPLTETFLIQKLILKKITLTKQEDIIQISWANTDLRCKCC